jgi:hypothetical protein
MHILEGEKGVAYERRGAGFGQRDTTHRTGPAGRTR